MTTETIQAESLDVPAAAPEGTPETPERPDWLPEKFKTAEDMAASYKELESKMSQAPAAEEAPAATPDDLQIQTPSGDAPEDVQVTELFDKYSESYFENGSLSDEAYAELDGKGFPRAIVDSYIQGQQALATAAVNAAHALAGGPEGFKTLQTWAADNMTPDAIGPINELLGSGDPTRIEIAVSTIKAARGDILGVDPTKDISGTPSAGGVQGYASRDEHIRATMDERYWTDPAYQKEVERKFQASKFS